MGVAWRTSSELSALVHSLGVATRTEPDKSKWLTLLPGSRISQWYILSSNNNIDNTKVIEAYQSFRYKVDSGEIWF